MTNEEKIDPVAWLVEWRYTDFPEARWKTVNVLFTNREWARRRAQNRPGYEARVVPLYRSPPEPPLPRSGR